MITEDHKTKLDSSRVTSQTHKITEIDMKNIEELKSNLDDQGFLVLEDVISIEELKPYAGLYDDVLSGKVDARRHRHDLGSHKETGTDQSQLSILMTDQSQPRVSRKISVRSCGRASTLEHLLSPLFFILASSVWPSNCWVKTWSLILIC